MRPAAVCGSARGPTVRRTSAGCPVAGGLLGRRDAGVDLTPLQRVTLYRLVEGTVTVETADRRSLRWLRRYGLVDADHVPTDDGRAYLERIRPDRRLRPSAPGPADPAAGDPAVGGRTP